MQTVPFILLLVGSQTVLSEQGLLGQNDRAPFIQADCQLLVVANLQRDVDHVVASTTSSVLLHTVTVLLGESAKIPSVCWSEFGDLVVHQSHPPCTSNVQPGEEHLFCLTMPFGECPKFASEVHALKVYNRSIQRNYVEPRVAQLRGLRQATLASASPSKSETFAF